MDLPIFYPTEASIEFCNVFQDGLLLSATCHCGRKHLSKQLCKTNQSKFDELIQDKPVMHEEAIPMAYFNGSPWVLRCACHKAGEIEAIVWQSALRVTEYIRSRIARENDILTSKLSAVAEIDKLSGSSSEDSD